MVILAICVLLVQYSIYYCLVKNCRIFRFNNIQENIGIVTIFGLIILVTYAIMIYYIYNLFLIPRDLGHLIIIILSLVLLIQMQIVEIICKKLSFIINIKSTFFPTLSIYCYMQVAFSVLLIISKYPLLEILAYCITISIGFSIMLYVYTFVIKKVRPINIMESARGLPIFIITIAIVSFAFFGVI